MQSKNIKLELKERVAKGLNFGIDAVEDVIDHSSDLFNEFVLLKSKYNDLMYVSSLNTIAYEQIELGLDRLRNNLIGIIDKLEAENLQKQDLDADMKIQSLPTRRTNFFKLLDIHFQNLEAVTYTEIYESNREVSKHGREAVFEIYQNHRRRLRSLADVNEAEAIDKIKNHFREYFSKDSGMLEVYFKNIKHLISYTLESEIEAQFFLNTLRSLFSRFEMALIFYYAVCDIDPEFKQLVIKSKLTDDSIRDILIGSGHLKYLV